MANLIPRILHLDFETRSTVDLRKSGAHKYAEHPDTGIWLASYAFDEGEPATWWIDGPNVLYGGTFVPPEIAEHIALGGIVYAHNAEFERVLWRMGVEKYGLPRIADEQWYDTAAEAAAMGLPRHLANVARVLGLEQQKDASGGRLMLQLARPRKLGEDGRPIWWETPEKLERLASYGLQDVRTERAVYHAVRRLGPRERKIWLLDQKINDRGLGLDVPLVLAMKSIAEQEIDAQNAKLADVTEGAVEATTQVAKLKEWVTSRGVTEVKSIDKAALRDLLARSDLPEDVAIALTARADAAKTSVAKLASMLAVVGKNDRMRGLLLYHAAHTGRWGGRNVQPHNFPRGEVKATEDAEAWAVIESYIPNVLDGSLPDVLALDRRYSVLTVLSSMLRSAIVPAPGYEFTAADYAAIELRGLAWAAQDLDLLEALRTNRPIYKEMSSAIYGVPVEQIEKGTIEYQIGKNAILGAGYGMGAPKFRKMVKEQNGIEISEEFAKRVIDIYRAERPLVKELWYDVERAAMGAVSTPGAIFPAGPVKFSSRGAYLWMVLPSGRALAYFAPKIVERPTPWNEIKPAVEVSHQNQITRQWERVPLYGGLLVENLVSAISRDVMADGMVRAEEAGYFVVLTVHDEIVSEHPIGAGSVEHFVAMLEQPPTWALGLPIKAEGWRGSRYRK
jgi:DNA polymerase family A